MAAKKSGSDAAKKARKRATKDSGDRYEEPAPMRERLAREAVGDEEDNDGRFDLDGP